MEDRRVAGSGSKEVLMMIRQNLLREALVTAGGYIVYVVW